MDEHGLPIVGAGVDYTKVRTIMSTCVTELFLFLGAISGA